MRSERIETVNSIINHIAASGRKFFSGPHGVASIFQKNGRLYMLNEYNGAEMCLSTKLGYPPKRWSNGGTLWGLVRDFKKYIETGEKSNGVHGYGGLYCPHWGYNHEDMENIQEEAKKLGYL